MMISRKVQMVSVVKKMVDVPMVSVVVKMENVALPKITVSSVKIVK